MSISKRIPASTTIAGRVDRRELEDAARQSLREVASYASRSPNAFSQFVLRDEATGARIRQAPMHRRWHELIDAHSQVVLWSHIESGKTLQISTGRSLYELGRNPNLRVCIISKTVDLARKIVRNIGQYIEKSQELRQVFPRLLPANDPSLPWTSVSLTVARGVRAKDPSLQATGCFGNIHGSRIDLLILDDILDHINTRTATPRESVWAWLRATVFGRLTATARVIALGNAFHPDDALHRLEREAGFLGFRFPVISPTGELSWPEQWPHERIADQRTRQGVLDFARACLCQARDDESARFRREYIARCELAGRGLRPLVAAVDLVRELGIPEDDLAADEVERRLGGRADAPSRLEQAGIAILHGVDLAVQRHASADLTSIFSLALFPDGQRRVLRIKSGRWGAPTILAEIKDTWALFGGTFVIENNAAQDYMIQILRQKTAIPIIPYTTGAQKAHPEFGVEHLAVEMEGGKWSIPSGDGVVDDPEIQAWEAELYAYDPRAHTGDRLMASWFADEGARLLERRRGLESGGTVGVSVLGD